MKHLRLLAEFLSTPWAMLPEHVALASSVLVRWALERAASPETMHKVAADVEARQQRKAQAAASAGEGIAVLPFYGLVTQRAVDDISGSGGLSTQQFGAALAEAVADDSIGGIVIDFDSPGGSISGVTELANQLRDARAVKPIYGVVNPLCASAAYWIAAQCSQLFAAPDSFTGSIGVYMAHEDVSKALDAAGVKVTFVHAGEFKVEGNAFEPLGADARAHMQSIVDAAYQAFTNAVARGRNVPVAHVRENMGKGRVLLPGAAHAAGMIDGEATLNETIRRLQLDMRASKRRSNPSALTLARHELDLIGR
jgi:signal peptide peptidase SppA